MTSLLEVDSWLIALAEEAEVICQKPFAIVDSIALHNTAKVLAAFRKYRISEAHLKGTTGYGYGDRGRDDLDRVVAEIFGAEDALVRHTFVSGTHALATALFGVLRPGDKLVSVTGAPYETLEATIGIRSKQGGSLQEFGVEYDQVELREDGSPDLLAIRKAAYSAKILYIQRSRGYSLRPSLSIAAIGEIVKVAKEVNSGVIIMVDNCYGELVEKLEPTQVGVDLVAGSLIKNLGGGVAPTGGYIAGRADLVELCAARLTCPGIGREVGCTLEVLRSLYLGLFLAPEVVASAVKTAIFAAALYRLLGYKVLPEPEECRTDIIQSILTDGPEELIAICHGVQKGAPIDSFVSPEPWDMPGYDSQVIMAAGAFTMGASIELSADAPLRPPYAVWLQGGLTYFAGRAGILLSAQELAVRGLVPRQKNILK